MLSYITGKCNASFSTEMGLFDYDITAAVIKANQLTKQLKSKNIHTYALQDRTIKFFIITK